MNQPATRPARSRWWKYLLVLITLFALCALGLLIYVHTDSFQSLVRRRLVVEVERVSGGRVEIDGIHTTPLRLQVDVRGITVHGTESATDVPLAHVDRIVGRLKLSSLLRSELAFHEVILEQPAVHVAFTPDGKTNIPERQLTNVTRESVVERLFGLSIDHLELRHGQILWDQRNLPLDFTARDMSLRMDYSFLHRRYDGRLLVGLVDTKLPDCRPFAWMSAAEFSLSSNIATVTSLKWNSGHSHLSARGHVTDFRNPHFQGQYDGQLDLSEVASIARRRDLRGGVMEVRGSGEWSLDQFASNGLLTLNDIAWEDAQIAFSRASLTAGYSITGQQLRLSKVQGRILGGSFSGDVELNGWLAPAQHLTDEARKALETAVISAPPQKNKRAAKASATRPPAIQNAVVTFHLRDLQLADVAAALNAPAHPFPHFHPAGLASGTVEARWKGTPQDAEIQFGIDLAQAVHHAASQVPISGRAQGTYFAASDTLHLPELSLTTPTSHLQAAGTLSATSAVRLSVHTFSLADWLPFLEVFRGPELFPVSLNGSATFTGNMTGSLRSPQIAGSLEVDDFEVKLPATNKTRPLQTHWDSLAASVQLSFQGIAFHNAVLSRGNSFAEFDSSASLDRGHLTGDSTFNLRANVHDVDLASILAVGRYDYPVSGTADFSIEAAGTISNPHGDGKIHLSHAFAYGETIEQFDSTFRLEHGAIAFNNIHLLHDGAVLLGSAVYNPSKHSFQIDVQGNNLDLAQVPQLHSSRMAVDGMADFTLKASGTPDAPSINLDLHVKDLALDRELAGELDLQAVTQGKQLHLTGNSHLQRGSLLIGGNIELRDGFPGNLNFKTDHLDVDPLWLSYVRQPLTGHSAVTGSVDWRGQLRDPKSWKIEGTLTALALEIDNVKLHEQDPIRFSVANESIDLQQLHLVGDATDLTAHGTVQFSGARALNFTADGRLDLKMLSTFDPDVTASGLVAMNLTVGGTLSQPMPQGHFTVTDGSLSYAGVPSGLSELHGSLLFSRDYVRIETLTARTGSGSIDFKGDANYFNHQLNFNLTATGKDVRLRYPPGVSSTADGELRWVGNRTASTVSGNILINRMAVTPGFDFSAYLEKSRQLNVVAGADSPLNNVKLDIHVVTAPELQMRTAVARLSGDADLRVRGSVRRPALLGRVDILEGQATFHGTKFTLERGDITFTNPVAIEPQLNLQATTRVRSYDLNITLTGTPDRGLSLNYRSEPPLPKSDIIALLALGRTSGESEQLQQQSGESTFSDQASAQILNEALSSTVTSRWQQLFGASNIKIDPQGLTSETNPISTGPQITIEQQFANHVSLTYSTNVSQSSQQIIQGEYFFNRNISAVGTRDQNGVISFDMRVRRRKK